MNNPITNGIRDNRITDDWVMTTQGVAYFVDQRCYHENDIEQLKNGVNAMWMTVK